MIGSQMRLRWESWVQMSDDLLEVQNLVGEVAAEEFRK